MNTRGLPEPEPAVGVIANRPPDVMGGWFYWRLRLLGWLQRQCTHPPELVSADMAEGCLRLATTGEEAEDMAAAQVHWCRICGAVRIGSGGWSAPRADWWIPGRYAMVGNPFAE